MIKFRAIFDFRLSSILIGMPGRLWWRGEARGGERKEGLTDHWIPDSYCRCELLSIYGNVKRNKTGALHIGASVITAESLSYSPFYCTPGIDLTSSISKKI